MRLLSWVATAACLVSSQVGRAAAAAVPHSNIDQRHSNGKINPKFFIISMFAPEADVWYKNLNSSNTEFGDLLAVNISAPGLSMLYPHVHCVADLTICQVTTGEAEINAAATIMAVVLSGKFELAKTYWMVGGIAGVSPKEAALGSVALSRYAIQVALQYEFDAREMPENFTTGYLPYGTFSPDQYPTVIYGTEVFELNEALRDVAYDFALRANLNTSVESQAYGEKYATEGPAYAAATRGPTVVKCDSATSDVYYTGTLLSEAFENTTLSWTNGSGKYCMTAQEDNATLEVLLRLAIEGLVDFARIIVMRTGSDFDRPPPGVTAFAHLRQMDQNGFSIALDNIYLAGVEIVRGVLKEWDCTFERGIKPTNYVGDIFGSLPGDPDFGPGSLTGGKGYKPGGDKPNTRFKRRFVPSEVLRERGLATPTVREDH